MRAKREAMITAIRGRYRDLWVAVRITKRSKFGIPSRGEVIATSKDHSELWRRVAQSGADQVYVFFAGRVPRKAIVL